MSFWPLELCVSRERGSANLDFTRLDPRNLSIFTAIASDGGNTPGENSRSEDQLDVLPTKVKENNPNLSRSIHRVIFLLMNFV